MNNKQIKIFLDVISEKSFVKAAKLNFRTQPTVTFQIKELEKELGVTLIERAPGHVQLTDDGREVLPLLEEIHIKHENLLSHLQALKGTNRGQVSIATIYSIGVYELTPFLEKFIKKYPDIQLQIQYRKSQIIYDLVSQNKVDLGLVSFPKSTDNVTANQFLTDHMVLITHKHHPLAQHRYISLDKLNGQHFIAFDEKSPTGKAIAQLLANKGISVDVRVKNENVDTIKSAVAVGLGLAIVPKRVVVKEVKEGHIRTIEIRDLHLDRPLGILTRKGKTLSPSVKTFLSMLNPKLNN